MGQTPTIDSIKKCKQDSLILSLQQTDKTLGVKINGCSTFLSKSGLLAQGEIENSKSHKRNALVTFRDSKTGRLKGWYFEFCGVWLDVFYLFAIDVIA